MSKAIKNSRREFLRDFCRYSGLAALGVGGVALSRGSKDLDGWRWQIDPHKCIACGKCQTNCVLDHSAVTCKHSFSMCGYCDLCTGYFIAEPNELNCGAENQQCPTGAIRRKFIEDPYYEYTIDPRLCIACAKCVKGCAAFGNGSLYMQIDQHRCKNCNECAIAVKCPAQAIVRVPAASPYLPKEKGLS
jgi:H+/Na+-translocating ferredoxin:NAD+ oxidoreductase subunit B